MVRPTCFKASSTSWSCPGYPYRSIKNPHAALCAHPRSSNTSISAGRRAFTTSLSCKDSYGFIGLGRMGAPMCANLAKSLKADDTLHIYDAVPSAIDFFMKDHGSSSSSSSIAAQIHPAKSSTQVIQSANTVITSLPNTSHVESVFKPFLDGLDGASSKQLKDKLFIDTSTISPAATKVLSDNLQEHGATLIDAPVSGGVLGATAGTLTFMISSREGSVSLELLKTLLSSMGKRIIVCGDYPGAGLAAKLANNYALALTNLATCDAMLLGQKLGLDPKVLAEVLNTSTGKSWPTDVNNPVPGVHPKAPASRDYDGGFGIALMRKDLDLALEAERKAGIVASGSSNKEGSSEGEAGTSGKLSDLSKVALDLYKTVEAKEEYSKKDFSVVYQYLKTLS